MTKLETVMAEKCMAASGFSLILSGLAAWQYLSLAT